MKKIILSAAIVASSLCAFNVNAAYIEGQVGYNHTNVEQADKDLINNNNLSLKQNGYAAAARIGSELVNQDNLGLGVEAGISYLDLGKVGIVDLSATMVDLLAVANLHANDNVTLFAKAGPAWAKPKAEATAGNVTVVSDNESTVKAKLVAGGEYKLNQHVGLTASVEQTLGNKDKMPNTTTGLVGLRYTFG